MTIQTSDFVSTLKGSGVAPVGVSATATPAAVTTTAATSTTPYGFATAAQADGIVALINQLRTDCVNAGISKG